MTHMVARLVLAMLLFPTAGGAFLLILVSLVRGAGAPPVTGLIIDCAAVYLLVVIYWFLLWRSIVRWTRRRILRTIGGTALSLACGLAAGALFIALNPRLPLQFPIIAVGGTAPVIWLLLTVLLWRETDRKSVV